MKTVRLSTREGAFVEAVRVPETVPPPDAIMWNERMFMHITSEHYSEGSFYVVPPMDVKVDKIPQ